MSKKNLKKPVLWLSDEISIDQKSSINFRHYEKFQFKNIVGGIGDYVLVSNADSAEPDTEEGCDAARIVALYEDTTNSSDPFRAKVQWYSRPDDLPKSSVNNMQPVDFLEREVLEDYRPFDTDVSIETFFKKCTITLTFTKDAYISTSPYNYVCRYRLMPINKRRVHLEPVLEEERKALQLLSTPGKTTPAQTPKTPSSLVKRMSRVSISEQKNWSITKNDGTKLLLKRAILADKTEKDSPKKATPIDTPKKPATPKRTVLMTNNKIEDMLSMELQENSDDELPTLIIRQHVPTTPKRKTSIAKSNDENTPRKVLHFEEDTKETPSKKSSRIRNPVNYSEPDVSPVKRTPLSTKTACLSSSAEFESLVKRTPRRSIRKLEEESDEDFKPVPKTPKTPKTAKVVRTPRTPGKTPKRRIISQLTPTLQSRAHSIDQIDDFSSDNQSLPGRESQLEEIFSFVKTKLLEGTSGCMYISGVPGTGKTATVLAALRALRLAPELPEFQLVEVNGMKIAEPRQVYVHIYKQLTGKSVVWEQACTLLDKRFTQAGPRRTPTVLLVDELDALCTRRQDVLYSIMEWGGRGGARLAVLAVANTMDLPERALAARVASRLGLTRLTFPPYTHAQLQTIVRTRLAHNVTSDALQLIARKVAAVSGDARRALALCSRALELAGGGGSEAGLGHVQAALAEAASGAAVRAVRAAAPVERLMLRAVAAEVERTGSEETTLSRALATAGALMAVSGRGYRAGSVRAPSAGQGRAACGRLAARRLLLLLPAPDPRLLLNVSVDDVHYATREITV